MTLQEQLTAFQKKRNEITARQEQILKTAGDEGRTLDEEEAAEYDGLTTELKHTDAHLERLRVHVNEDAGKKTEVKGKGPTILVRNQDKDDDFQGQSFVRRVIAKAEAQLSGYEKTASQIAQERWGKTHPTLVRVIKAAVSGGGETTGEWGAELVAADGRYTGDFIEFLRSQTIFDRLPLREVPAHVTIKGQDGQGSGYWVGEGAAIPASEQDFSTVTLTESMVGAISVVSKRLLRHSSPSAEMLVRDSLVDSLRQVVDTTFLGTSAASGATPAGILAAGMTPVNSNGTDAKGLRSDIYELYEPFLAAKNASGLWFVMTPSLAKAISLIRNTLGQREFEGLNASGGMLEGDQVLTGDNVGATHMILLKPSDIWRIGDEGVEVSLSMDATIEMEDGPTGDSLIPSDMSAPRVSMFQTESVAFKVTRLLNYAKRRSHAAQYVVDANYGVPGGTTA